MDKITYRESIARIRRIAQIIPNMHSIIFEPRGDGASFNMKFHVQSMNEDVQFGILAIPKDFISFLKSGWAPKNAWSTENAYYYLQEGILDIDRQTYDKAYKTISNNLKILQSGNEQAINNFLHTGFPNVSLNTVVDTNTVPNNSAHNAFVEKYLAWKKAGVNVGVSKAQPYMAKRKEGLNRISSRKIGDGNGK